MGSHGDTVGHSVVNIMQAWVVWWWWCLGSSFLKNISKYCSIFTK